MSYTATYTAGDFDDILFDLLGTFVSALTENASVLAMLIIASIIVVLVIDLLKGTFGIFKRIGFR